MPRPKIPDAKFLEDYHYWAELKAQYAAGTLAGRLWDKLDARFKERGYTRRWFFRRKKELGLK